jgi:DNA-binding GntR family transcriptional regulator
MFEVRAVLEGLALRFAAQKATEQEIAELQAIVERMER